MNACYVMAVLLFFGVIAGFPLWCAVKRHDTWHIED